jgi:hypothetical protein
MLCERVFLCFFPVIEEEFRKEDQKKRESTADQYPEKGVEEAGEAKDLKVEKGGVMDQHQDQGIVTEPFDPLVFQ